MLIIVTIRFAENNFLCRSVFVASAKFKEIFQKMNLLRLFKPYALFLIIYPISAESGISVGSNSSSPCMVDGYTQTTLKRGVHRSDSGVSSDCSLSLTTGTSPESNLLSTDVSLSA